MGHMRGEGPARRATNTALGLVMEAIGAKVAQPRGSPGARPYSGQRTRAGSTRAAR